MFLCLIPEILGDLSISVSTSKFYLQTLVKIVRVKRELL